MMTLHEYVKKGLFYKSVVEDGSDIIFIVDYNGLILYHNHSVEETLGYKPNSLVGKTFFDFILPETLPEFREKYQVSISKPFHESVEFRFLTSEGSYKYLEFNSINVKQKENIEGLILDCRDITQRKKDAEELLRAQKAKEQFLANVSHEIRTPINGIAGMVTLLMENPTPQEQGTYLNAVKSAAENLKVIINDILDLASIESGKLKFEWIGFDIKDLLTSIIDSFTVQSKSKGLSISLSVDEQVDQIFVGDPFRLNQILINLISNALKFTHSGSISLRCAVEKQQEKKTFLRFEVQDTGIGIPSSKLKKIFESFSQADASVTRKYGGTGLGLTIVKQLVELQDGSISVNSEEGKGTTFNVIIPYAVGSQEDIGESTSFTHKKNTELTSIKDLNVLLVEDNDINRLYATSILKMWECNTEIAENGFVAVEKSKSGKFDVVLMDIQMPVMDGYEATKAIRQSENAKSKIPIIALTANANASDIQKCLASGMNDCIAKPFSPETLFSTLIKYSKRKPVPAEPSQKRNLIDLTYLKKVSNNDKGFITEIVRSFLDSTPKTLQEIKSQMKSEDWVKLEKEVHKIKPTLVMIGLHHLRELAVQIEKEVTDGPTPKTISILANSFCEQLELALDELRTTEI
ncbi:MAG: ATP-binding protein [Cyclobacteriaceae bacterium]